jgi:hypothetical protein
VKKRTAGKHAHPIIVCARVVLVTCVVSISMMCLLLDDRVCTHYRAATLYSDKTVMTPIKISYNDEGQRQ